MNIVRYFSKVLDLLSKIIRHIHIPQGILETYGPNGSYDENPYASWQGTFSWLPLSLLLPAASTNAEVFLCNGVECDI